MKYSPGVLSLHLALGNALLQSKSAAAALEVYEAAAKAFPGEARAWHGIGSSKEALYGTVPCKSFVDAYYKALRLNPKNEEVGLFD